MTSFFDTPWHAATEGMMSWYQAKMFVEHASVVSSDALHVLAGVILWLLIALVLRSRASAVRPLLILLVLLAFNELVDLWVEQWPDKAVQYGESAKDLLLTMALPTMLMALSRLRPQLFGSPAVRGSRRRSGGKAR